MRSYIRQFLKFSCVGVLNTGIDLLLYFVLTRFTPIYFLVANIFSFSAATVNSYFLNKYWTFRDKEKASLSQYGKFFVVSVVGLLLNEVVLAFFVWLGVYDLFSKILAVGISLIWNFFANRFLIFKR